MKLFLWPAGLTSHIDTELGQARVRVVFVMIIMAGYAVAIWVFQQKQLVPARPGLLLYFAFGYVWSWLVVWDIGPAVWRQRAAVVLDHTTFSIGLAWAGLALAPILWVSTFISVGHGLRFGESRAHFSAVLGAMSMGIAMYLSPEWHAQPLVASGVVLSAWLVPVYAVSLARQIEVLHKVSEAKALELEEAAGIDDLTALLNRTGFERVVCEVSDEAGAATETVAVLYLDLDGFKTVNDTLGHTAGNHVLQQAAFQLKRSLRASDAIARIGGDEFAVLLRSPGNSETLSGIGEKVLGALGSVHPPQHPELRVSASIGICIALQGRSVASAVEYADTLMYKAKRAGKGQVMVGHLTQDVEVRPASIGDAV